MAKNAIAVCPFVDAQFHAQAKTPESMPAPTQIEVAFAGRSNVGKSSLLNALLDRKNLVRTSQTPGCTQAINFFSVRTRGGSSAQLVDLPGYGYAQRSKSERRSWGALIEGYLLYRPTLRAVVLLVDVRREFEDDEAGLLELLAMPAQTSRPDLVRLVVATKTDQLTLAAVKPRLLSLSKAAGQSVLGISVEDPQSIERLRRRVLAIVEP
ncbi:MAG TPA: ribosome biogenesis GTP-binding protein YihA/YsxC, partial [Polyangiaceae bacterium]